jgi:RecA/RadA recombinase
VGGGGPGLQGRVLVWGLRRLARAAQKGSAVAVFLNQTRGDAQHADADTSAGGPGLKLYAAVRIALAHSGTHSLHFQVMKNKAGKAFGEGQLHWHEAAGWVESP